jgi:hypothetical protein
LFFLLPLIFLLPLFNSSFPSPPSVHHCCTFRVLRGDYQGVAPFLHLVQDLIRRFSYFYKDCFDQVIAFLS